MSYVSRKTLYDESKRRTDLEPPQDDPEEVVLVDKSRTCTVWDSTRHISLSSPSWENRPDRVCPVVIPFAQGCPLPLVLRWSESTEIPPSKVQSPLENRRLKGMVLRLRVVSVPELVVFMF